MRWKSKNSRYPINVNQFQNFLQWPGPKKVEPLTFFRWLFWKQYCRFPILIYQFVFENSSTLSGVLFLAHRLLARSSKFFFLTLQAKQFDEPLWIFHRLCRTKIPIKEQGRLSKTYVFIFIIVYFIPFQNLASFLKIRFAIHNTYVVVMDTGYFWSNYYDYIHITANDNS